MPALVLLPGPPRLKRRDGAPDGRLPGQVRSREDGASAAEIDARDRLQQAQRALVLGQFGSDAGIQIGDGGGGPVEGLDLNLQFDQRERVEGGSQGLGQRLQLGVHVVGQAVEDAVRWMPGDEPVEDAPPVDAEDVRQDAAEAQAVVVEGLVDSLRFRLCPATRVRR